MGLQQNEASNPATKDDRKQPDATEKIITTLMWIADVSNKGRIFQERGAPWRKSRPISSRFRALPTNSKNQLLCGVHPPGTTYAEHRLRQPGPRKDLEVYASLRRSRHARSPEIVRNQVTSPNLKNILLFEESFEFSFYPREGNLKSFPTPFPLPQAQPGRAQRHSMAVHYLAVGPGWRRTASLLSARDYRS
jgi:hypothetical protein